MSDADIADVISGFANSARYAKELGFDGVELHGAHGYLIDQFFWEGTNERDDKYGGSLAARANFAADVARAVRAAVGRGLPAPACASRNGSSRTSPPGSRRRRRSSKYS